MNTCEIRDIESLHSLTSEQIKAEAAAFAKKYDYSNTWGSIIVLARTLGLTIERMRQHERYPGLFHSPEGEWIIRLGPHQAMRIENQDIASMLFLHKLAFEGRINVPCDCYLVNPETLPTRLARKADRFAAALLIPEEQFQRFKLRRDIKDPVLHFEITDSLWRLRKAMDEQPLS